MPDETQLVGMVIRLDTSEPYPTVMKTIYLSLVYLEILIEHADDTRSMPYTGSVLVVFLCRLHDPQVT